MSTVGMIPQGRRRHSSRHSRPSPPSENFAATALTRVTDVTLISIFIAVSACFAGRTPLGQLVFASLSAFLAICWSLRQLVAKSPVWHSTTSGWLWIAGIALAGMQVIPLSQAWLDWFSPEISRLLVMWMSDETGLFPARWNTLSLNPTETRSGLVTFLSYALLFFVVTQRIRDREDVAWLLKAIVFVGTGMAVFGILQYVFSNGLFFWVYQHPTVSTTQTVLGTFTNRNHVAQFLALAIGPAFWWLSQLVHAKQVDNSFGGGGTSTQSQALTVGFLACGLGAMLLASLMSLSRAGTVAVAVSCLASLILLCRRGHLSGKTVGMFLLIGTVVVGGSLASNYQLLADRFDRMDSELRTTIWSANIRLACRFPWFGTGIGTHLHTHQLETDRIDDDEEFTHAESGYLQVASEGGFVGLTLALLMIALCLNWGRKAYRSEAGPRSSAMAAGILASFIANLLHALVDFFWYAPACMIVVTVLAACVCRLSQWADAAAGQPEPTRQPPRLAWGASLVGLSVLATWMISVKLPAALAEPHLVEYYNLVRHSDDLADSPEELEQLKMRELVAVARANPHDCRAQLRAAAGYLRVFAVRQEASETPLTLDQLRDAALASEFESSQSLSEWLDAVTGSNRKYLRAARLYSRRALMACPVEGQGYIYLSQLEFLRDPQARFQEALQNQALTVRPYDALIDFEVGRAASWNNDSETAMFYWRKAFQRSPKYRQSIATALAGNYDAEELIEQLEPDRQGLKALVKAYADTDRTADLRLIRQTFAKACLEEAQHLVGQPAELAWMDAVRTYSDAEQPMLAIRTAQTALEHWPQSQELHKTLGTLLFQQEDYAGAAKHLHWAALRAPEDARLKSLAAMAVKEKLRHQNLAEGVQPAGHESLR